MMISVRTILLCVLVLAPRVVSAAEPISFLSDVLPVLSKAGCNAGACHAKPDGQAGFKLSVFAYDPKSDYREIVKDARGRRVFPAAPEESLLLKKPTTAVEHGGGKRIDAGSPQYQLLSEWIRQGMPYAREGEPALKGIEVSPREGSYRKKQALPLKVAAKYSDGSTRDVTALADYLSNDKAVATADEAGNVRVADLPGSGGETVIVARFMGMVDVARITVPSSKSLPDSLFAALPANNFIDTHVYSQLKRLGVLPSDLCSDEEFVRRASLDVAGMLPTVEETKAFLADTSPDKRSRWIDAVLAKPNYAEYWATKWNDLLRPNTQRVGIKSVYLFDQWLRESFRQNKPYDRMVRELLTAQGSTHRYGPVVLFRDRRQPEDVVTMVSQVFLGVRLECAKCHHHPNEKWGQEDFYQLSAFFAQLKRKGQGISAPISGEPEYIWSAPGGGVKHPVTGEAMPPRVLDSTEVVEGARDPREALADWLARADNPFFARAIVNRVWGEMIGRGIVEPVDDFRASNPPTNAELLDALARDFIAQGFDLKHLVRRIATSRVYQLSSAPNETNVADTKNFSRAYRRRLPAEVLLDAVVDVTGIPDTFDGMPPGSRAVQAWNYKLDSPFMDAFSRPNSSADPPCDRDRGVSVIQALHMMNSTRLQTKLASADGRVTRLVKSDKSEREIVEELYFMAYSRKPNDDEMRIALDVFKKDKATRQSAAEDLLWALLNSAEFVFNH